MPLRRVCQAIEALHWRLPDVEFLWPVHPNPSVKSVVADSLGGLPRVRLCEPMSYPRFVAAMKRSTLILTDSGGIQEEAPSLGKPVLILREISERPEAVEAGLARLVGQDPTRIVEETCRLLNDHASYQLMTTDISPFGDGTAASKIVDVLASYFVMMKRGLDVGNRTRAAG
jgi:UDP-N-acetylglucosamine 2-epimerase (non-hydrolysing)